MPEPDEKWLINKTYAGRLCVCAQARACACVLFCPVCVMSFPPNPPAQLLHAGTPDVLPHACR